MTAPVWLIGCGNMAGAMLRGWIDAGEDPARFHVVNRSPRPLPDGVIREGAPPEGGFGSAIVQLGVKPQMLDEVAPDLAPLVGPATALVSILAGVETASLRRRFPDAATVVRAMPNMPVALRKGAVGLTGEDAGHPLAKEMLRLAAELGTAEWIADEALFDVVTALSGSGPAFLYRFVDALARGGAALGLDRDQALRLAIATVEGAAAQAAAADEDPRALADRVASPGGSTRKGLDVLDADGALDRLLLDTLEAARRRNAEMAAAARR